MNDPDLKKTLRQQALKNRDALVGSAVDSGDLSDGLVSGLQAVLDGFEPGILAGFWPIRTEADPRTLYTYAEQQGWTIALPCVTAEGMPLVFRTWETGQELVAGYKNIPEPAADAREVQPALALVPLAAFDRAGGRIGYGGGFYDRTLEKWAAAGYRIPTIGCAYSVQEVDRVPMDAHDVHLDMIVTEKETIVVRSTGQVGDI